MLKSNLALQRDIRLLSQLIHQERDRVSLDVLSRLEAARAWAQVQLADQRKSGMGG